MPARDFPKVLEARGRNRSVDLRRHARAPIQTEVWLGQDGIFTRTSEKLRDLSEGGAFVETGQRFSLGSILSLRFKLPHPTRMISCTVSVQNLRDGTGLGVKFLDLSPEDQRLVSAFISNTVPA